MINKSTEIAIIGLGRFGYFWGKHLGKNYNVYGFDTDDSKKDNLEINEDVCGVRVIHSERISQAKSEAVPENELERMALIYKMLGDPTRLKILLALRNNEMCVCDLAAFTCLTESAVSHQLRRLRDTALVKKRRDGQVLYYSLDDEHVNSLLNIGLEHVRE